MKARIGIVWMVCCVCAVLAGPNDKTVVAEPKGNAAKLQDVSKIDFKRLLIPGRSTTNEIVKALGKPTESERGPSGELLWNYTFKPFPAKDQVGGRSVDYILGVTTVITNGRLAHWGYISAMVPADRVVAKHSIERSVQSGDSVTAMKFFVVSSQSIEGGRSIDTTNLPALGFIPALPALTISKVKGAEVEERVLDGSSGKGETNWKISIHLFQEDAPRLTALTATNLGNKVLIMFGNQPICAPTVNDRLETVNFELTTLDKSTMELVKDQLGKMVQ